MTLMPANTPPTARRGRFKTVMMMLVTTSSTINPASDGNDGTDGSDDTGGTSCHNMYVLLQGAEAAAAAERPTSRDGGGETNK